MDPLIARIRDFIGLHGLFTEGDRLLLSLSAGKDSMFLLHVISELRGAMGIEAGIFHLNHGMRGVESDRDGEFVRAMGERHGMDSHVCSHDFKRERRAGLSFEEDARNVRYRLLHRIAMENRYSVMATAHSMDDQVETVLMRLVTGTGIHGLQGIPPKRGAIVRPLLAVSSEEIYDYLKVHGLEWREDASNEDTAYARNYIRNRILPVIREKFPMADGAILSLGEVAGETISMIDGLIHDRYPHVVTEEDGDAYMDAEALRRSFPLFAHVLSSVIRGRFNHHVNRSMLREVYSKYLVERANVNIYADKRIRIEKLYRGKKSRLRLYAAGEAETVAPRWIYRIDPDAAPEQIVEIKEIGISVTVKAVDHEFFEKFRKNAGYIFVTLENNNESIYIRNRREGDCIGTEKGRKKVKKLFIEKKLDNASKDQVPLLLAGDTVIACMTGFLFDIPNRIAADFLVDKNSKKVIAVIKN